MRIYLLRHGETSYNITKQYTGTLDIPVSESGLKKMFKADFNIERVYVSTLRRTGQTAQVLFPSAEQIEIFDLRERCFGSLEGQKYISFDNEGCFEKVASDGESKNDFAARACKAFTKIINEERAKGSKKVVIVAHGGIQMSVLSQFARPELPYEQWCAKNAGGFVLEINEDDSLKVIDKVCYSL